MPQKIWQEFAQQGNAGFVSFKPGRKLLTDQAAQKCRKSLDGKIQLPRHKE